MGINLKTLKHHIDHIFMIRLGTMLKASTLTFDKYVRIKNNDRRIMKVLIGLTTAKGYVENDDVFGTLDKALKSAKVDGSSKDRDNEAVQSQVRELLRRLRVQVSEKDFVYHMNKIITIILGMMLHVGVLTFTKFHQMKCTHRADMEDMVTSAYDPNADVFGVLERAIEKQHKAVAPMPRRKAPEPKRPERRRAPEDDMTQRQGQMLDQGWDPNDRPEDHSMAKLGRILDSRGTLNSQLFEGPSVRSVQDQTIEDQRAAAWQQPIVPEDPVEIFKQLKEQEAKEAAEKARKEKEAIEAAEKYRKEKEKEAAENARKEKEAKEAAEKAKRDKEAKEAEEKARKAKEAAEKEAKEAAERAQKIKEAKEAAEKARKEQEEREAAEKARLEQEAKEAAEKAKKEQEAKEAAAKAKKQEAKDAAEKAKREQEAKELTEKALERRGAPE